MKSDASFSALYTLFIMHLYNKTPVKPVKKAVDAEISLVQILKMGFVRP